MSCRLSLPGCEMSLQPSVRALKKPPRLDDEVRVQVPKGTREFEVLEIVYEG